MQLIDGDCKDHIQIKKRKRMDMPSCDKAEASGQKGMLTPPMHLIRSCHSALNKMVDSLLLSFFHTPSKSSACKTTNSANILSLEYALKPTI